MSSIYLIQKINHIEKTISQNKVKVTDLLSRLNEEKKIEKKRNLALRCCCGISSDSFWDYSYNLIQLNIIHYSHLAISFN